MKNLALSEKEEELTVFLYF